MRPLCQPRRSTLPRKTYIVTLTSEERDHLHDLITKGKAAAYKQRHARILLKTDQGAHGEHWTDEQIERAVDVHVSTVERLRKRFVEEGFEAALQRKEQKNRKEKKIDGRAEAHLVALAAGVCEALVVGQIEMDAVANDGARSAAAPCSKSVHSSGQRELEPHNW